MRKLLCWLFWLCMAVVTWDFLFKESEIIAQAPTVFVIALLLAVISASGGIYWILEKLYRGKINNLESQIDLLKQSPESKPNSYESLLKDLKENEFKALEIIEKFGRSNPRIENKLPLHYSVDQLQTELNVSRWEANEIIRKLKQLNLVYCAWENEPLFPDITQPMGEERPVMLRSEGRDLLTLNRINNKQ